VNSAKIDIEHKYFLLAVELQRMHAELHKLHGVVKEFQERIPVDDSELSSLPPTDVIDSYVKEVHRIVSELDDTNFDERDKSDVDDESLATTALSLRRENDSLRRSIDQLQSEKRDLEKQLGCVEDMIVLARYLSLTIVIVIQ